MKRAILVLSFVVVGLLGQARPASAGFWAWLEEFSGPGPFHGKTYVATVCLQDGLPRLSPVALDSTAGPRKLLCYFTDFGSFSVDPNPVKGFPAVKAKMVDFGASARLYDWLDLGAGIGEVSFHVGDDVHSKLTLTPVRLVLRPLLLMPSHDAGTRRMRGFLSLYLKETFVTGPITGADFGVPAPQFHSSGELKTSLGVIFDLTALCPKALCKI